MQQTKVNKNLNQLAFTFDVRSLMSSIKTYVQLIFDIYWMILSQYLQKFWQMFQFLVDTDIQEADNILSSEKKNNVNITKKMGYGLCGFQSEE
jgi:hypothetical protein